MLYWAGVRSCPLSSRPSAWRSRLAVRCNPSTSSASAMCTAGKWVSEKLYVGYQQHLSPLPDENTSQLDFEYYLLSHVTINISGGDRNDGVDVLWRKRW